MTNPPAAASPAAASPGGPAQRPDAADLESLGSRVEADLENLLVRRSTSSRSSVLGAGHDDLDAGRRYLEQLARGGYAAPTWPTEHGGMGLDPAAAEVVSEVVAGFETPDLYPFMVGIDLIGPTLLAHGDGEQARRWLSDIRTGARIWCQLFSEPDAGSDLANLKARARPEAGTSLQTGTSLQSGISLQTGIRPHGDAWILDGSKVWTSRGHYADWGLLLARSDPAVPKHRGITAFGLDMASGGITVRPLVQANGDAHFNEVFFDHVTVPDADRIGPVGGGWAVAMTCLSLERGALAGGLGVSRDQLVALARTPGVARNPVRRDALAADLARLEILGWSGRRELEGRRSGRPPGAEGSLAKLATNAVVKDVASLGLAASGPAATVVSGEPDEWQTMWLVAPSLSIRGGTDEIQRNIVGERVLGLPPEPRVDKDRPFDEQSGERPHGPR